MERTVDLAEVRLRLRDWPGIGGPLVHLPDPVSPGSAVAEALGASFGPMYRVVSIEPRAAQPYQVHAADVLATLDQFGFRVPVLIGERLGCVAALLLAAWFPDRIAQLVLIDPTYAAPLDPRHSIEARALTDCPPDWPSLRSAVRCPVVELRWSDAVDQSDLPTLLQLRIP